MSEGLEKQTVDVEGIIAEKKQLNGKINQDLLTLVNVILQASYQFLLLSVVSKELKMPRTGWIIMKKNEKCSDSVVEILSWISDNGGSLELADIVKPRFDESKLNGEFVFQRWDEIEKWIESKIEEIIENVEESDYENKDGIFGMLQMVLYNIKSNS